MKTVVNFKNNRITNIIKLINNKENGERLLFYSNGKLSKKAIVSHGIYTDYCYEFYPSGSALAYTFYCGIYPSYFGIEYWDGPLNTMKKSIHYGERGKIERIRFFDSLGNFIKDSIPY